MSYENETSREIIASNIRRLMRKKGVVATDVCKALDIPNATFSDWINAKTYPRISKIEKLAEYFGVSRSDIIDIYIDREDPAYEAARVKPYIDQNDTELLEYLEYLRTRPEARILMSTMRGATKEEVEENVRFIEALRKSRRES